MKKDSMEILNKFKSCNVFPVLSVALLTPCNII